MHVKILHQSKSNFAPSPWKTIHSQCQSKNKFSPLTSSTKGICSRTFKLRRKFSIIFSWKILPHKCLRIHEMHVLVKNWWSFLISKMCLINTLSWQMISHVKIFIILLDQNVYPLEPLWKTWNEMVTNLSPKGFAKWGGGIQAGLHFHSSWSSGLNGPWKILRRKNPPFLYHWWEPTFCFTHRKSVTNWS